MAPCTNVRPGKVLIIVTEKSDQMKDEEFTCEHCGRTFLKAWTEEEAMKELKANFGDREWKRDELCILCDDCYQLARGLFN